MDHPDERPGFSDLLAQLGDSDVVIEAAAGSSARRPPEIGALRRVQEAVAASYQALAGSIGLKLDTIAIVEEASKCSLSLWLRAQSQQTEADGSLYKFLARGTLAIIAWMDGSSTLQLADLQQAIRVLAWGTSITTTAHPVLPSSGALVDAISAWQVAKGALEGCESARIVTSNGSARLDLSKRISEPRALLQTRKLVNHSAEMIFVVEMPDYQGTGQWLLRHGGNRTTAVTEPGTLLDKFYNRELDVRPGDALRCKVDFETSYGPDHEVLAERYRIVEILEVLPAEVADTKPEGAAVSAPVHDPVEDFEPAS